jgi:sugar O-acyltransferase (sialic acid O-acetyltransferase NeuD family)
VRNKLVVVGGHGSGEMAMSVFDAVNEHNDEWDIEGFLSDIGDPGSYLGKHPIVGGTDEVVDFVDRGYHVHYTLHFNAKNKLSRVERLRSLGIPDDALATAIHPRAHIEPSVTIGKGVLASAYAGTSFGATIKNHVHLYSFSYLAHDTIIEDFVGVTAHSIVGARVTVEEGAHIGLNATIREDVRIGRYALVGMASVVLNDVEPFQIVGGNPARPLGTSRVEN